jgi:glycosyltransferase involved in cell wall biosynthesis
MEPPLRVVSSRIDPKPDPGLGPAAPATAIGGSAEPPWLSVVGPVHDERSNLALLYGEIRAALEPLATGGRGWELILVDDASTDGSLEEILLLAARDPRVRALRLPRRRGQSAALAAGIRAARGAVTVTLDTDLQNDPADVPRMLELLERFDYVCGVRRRRRDSLGKRWSSRIANAARRAALGDRFQDVGCGLRAARTALLLDLPLFDGVHRFVGPLLAARGARVAEVPVGHRPRAHGRSKYGVHDRLWRGIRDLFGVRWLQSRQIDPASAEEMRPAAEEHGPPAEEVRPAAEEVRPWK